MNSWTALGTRRNLMKALTGTAGVLLSGGWGRAMGAQTPQPRPSPNAPSQNTPAGLNSTEIIHPGQEKPPPNTMNHLEIAASVQQLFKLATELKDEVEHTNLRQTLPLDFVKRAQQIEKLAKQIKDRAKG